MAPLDYSIVQRVGAPDLALYWSPADHAVAVMVFVHGFGEHMGRYGDVFAAFPRCHCLGFDLRGHGHSGGARGQARREGSDRATRKNPILGATRKKGPPTARRRLMEKSPAPPSVRR